MGRNVVRNNHSLISGTTPAVALNDGQKPPEVIRDGQWAASPARQSEWCSQGVQRSATLFSQRIDGHALSRKYASEEILYSSQLALMLRLQARIMGNDVPYTSSIVLIHQRSSPWKHGRGTAV